MVLCLPVVARNAGIHSTVDLAIRVARLFTSVRSQAVPTEDCRTLPKPRRLLCALISETRVPIIVSSGWSNQTQGCSALPVCGACDAACQRMASPEAGMVCFWWPGALSRWPASDRQLRCVKCYGSAALHPLSRLHSYGRCEGVGCVELILTEFGRAAISVQPRGWSVLASGALDDAVRRRSLAFTR
jgi:hypothetical protein